MSKSLFHSLSKEFDDTLDTSLYPFETKRKWKGCGVREIALELPRSSTRRYSPVRRFSKRARAFLPIDWSARIALFKANPLSRDSFSFHHSRNSTKFRVNDPCSSDTREGSFQEEIYRRNLKIFSRVGLERESRKIPRKMENISSKWKNSFVPSAE